MARNESDSSPLTGMAYEMDITLIPSWHRRIAFLLKHLQFTRGSFGMQLRMMRRETNGARLKPEEIIEVLGRQRNPLANVDLVCGCLLGLLETELGLTRDVVDEKLRGLIDGRHHRRSEGVIIPGARVCLTDHILATGEGFATTAETAMELARAILPAVNKRVVEPKLAGLPFDAGIRAAVDEDPDDEPDEPGFERIGQMALEALLNAPLVAPCIVSADVRRVGMLAAEYFYAKEIDAKDLVRRAKKKLSANYRAVEDVVGEKFLGPYVYPAGLSVRCLWEPVVEAAGATWPAMERFLDDPGRPHDGRALAVGEEMHSKKLGTPLNSQILARRANLATSPAAADAARAMRAGLDRFTPLQRAAYYCTILQYLRAKSLENNPRNTDKLDPLNDGILAVHLVPVLAEFDSTLKVFTQLVDFGRTGTLRDFETWSVAALVEHLGNDCYVDEAGLVGPTGPPVDRWLSGEPLETAELARFRTNGSHTVALLRWAQGLLGPLACAFKVLGAIEGLHLKSILEGPDCRDPADVHPHIPERHLWKRTLSFDTVATRVLLQTIGKGAFPLEIVPSTIRGLRALRLRFKEFGGERWYPEGGLLNAKTEITCCVCLEVITWRDQVTLRPCDHSVCLKCSKQLDACPLCRTAITDLCSPSQFPEELNNHELFKICGLHPTIVHAGLEILELGERRSARAPGWPSLQGVRLVEVFIERTGGRVDRYLGDSAILEEKAQPLNSADVGGRHACCNNTPRVDVLASGRRRILPGCPNVEAGTKFLRCSKCKFSFYCGKQCQAKHWKDHKVACGRLSALFSESATPCTSPRPAPGKPPGDCK